MRPSQRVLFEALLDEVHHVAVILPGADENEPVRRCAGMYLLALQRIGGTGINNPVSKCILFRNGRTDYIGAAARNFSLTTMTLRMMMTTIIMISVTVAHGL